MAGDSLRLHHEIQTAIDSHSIRYSAHDSLPRTKPKHNSNTKPNKQQTRFCCGGNIRRHPYADRGVQHRGNRLHYAFGGNQRLYSCCRRPDSEISRHKRYCQVEWCIVVCGLSITTKLLIARSCHGNALPCHCNMAGDSLRLHHEIQTATSDQTTTSPRGCQTRRENPRH